MPDNLWVSQSSSLKGGTVSANRSHSLLSTEEEKEGKEEEEKPAAQSYFNHRTHFEGLVSKHWTHKKHGLIKRKVFLRSVLSKSAGT